MWWLSLASTVLLVINDKAVTSAFIQPSRCNETTRVVFGSRCGVCSIWYYPCPFGSQKVTTGIKVKTCMFSMGRGPLYGCARLCERFIINHVCCSGFWGRDCQPCPGIESNKSACYGKGNCSDLSTGNGTCHCDDGFEGFACEMCSDKTKFGDNCQKNCTCKNGICSMGNGTCEPYTCKIGYHGPNCEFFEPSCNNSCRENNSHCVVGKRSGCQCNPGYHGVNGTNCEAINLCIKPWNVTSPCPSNSDCHYTGPRSRKCVCADGYTGDGWVCIAIDHCQYSNGNCPSNTTCNYQGPGKISCSCLPGYSNLVPKIGCSMVDLCVSYGCPDINAECYMVKAGQKACRCKSGYLGNGTLCYGNILQRIDDLNRDGQYKNDLTLIKSLITRHGHLARPFAGAGPFTVFIPTNDGLRNKLTTSQRSRIFNNADLALSLLLSHSAFGFLTTNKLAKNGNFTTLKGRDAVVTNNTNFFYQLREQPIKSKILTADIIATNGIIHILEVPAWIPNITTIHSTSSLTVWQVINQKPELQTLRQYILQIAGMRTLYETFSLQGITLIAPNNEAFKTLPSNVTEFLKSPKGRIKLAGILRNHIYNKKIDIFEMIQSRSIMSHALSSARVYVNDQGAVILGGTAKLVETNIPTSNGILYVTSGLLIPSFVKPIIEKRCDVPSVGGYVYSSCRPCWFHNRACPKGTVPTGSRTHCTHGLFHQCRDTCAILVPHCCSGFYGPNCLACPGALSSTPCYGNGKCFDDMSGNGTCMCKNRFTGTACELCKDNTNFGLSCDKKCTCVNGVCNGGLNGNGLCLPHTCKVGYGGNNCSIARRKCGHSSIRCSIHAECVSYWDGFLSSRCVCRSGYNGDGVNCYEVDPCEKANGGCDRNALCRKTGPGLHNCTCNAGWTGDGTYCGPIDYCATPSRGFCHKYAKCIFLGPAKVNCECLPGYQGDGISCKEIDSCSISNGNCSPFAKCTRLGPGQNNCKCRFAYTGDGYSCRPSMAVVMKNRKELKIIYRLIAKSNLLRYLTFSKVNATIFLASDSAMNKLNASLKAKFNIPKNLFYYGGSNMARGIFNSANLKNISSLPSLFKNLFINISVSNTSKLIIGGEAEVIVSDIAASNGIIHIVDKVLFPPFYLQPPDEADLFQVLCHENQTDFNEICKFITKYKLESILKNCTHCTIFAPTDDSFDDLKSHHYYNFSLTDLQYHITEHYILPSSIRKAQQFPTLAGQYYVLLLEKASGEVKVNGLPLTVVDSANRWVIYSVSSVLKPARKICFKTTNLFRSMRCRPCFRRPWCPLGYRYAGDGRCNFFFYAACTANCKKPIKVRKCCPGFWGKYCDACPGKNDKPCFGNGVCNNATGVCNCNQPFNGTACEKCIDGHYGDKCRPCNCTNGGTCDLKTGFCYCPPKWKGMHCQNSVNHSSCGNTTCHQYASCNKTNNTCQCDHGYTGNGTNCEHTDFCQKNKRGCSPNARCEFRGSSGKITCSCKPNYFGDGIYCQGVNSCKHQGIDCHSNANCIYLSPGRHKCDCKAGYSGDGKKACSIISLCSEDNGGCSVYAKCTFHEQTLNTSCQCRNGYIGNGTVCTGDLMESLQTNPELTEFFSRLKNSIIQEILSPKQNFSVIAPTNNAFTSSSPRKRRSVMDVSETDLKYYIVSCISITKDDVTAAGKSFVSIAGSWLNITSPLVINDNMNILSVIETVNGAILIVDKIINAPVRNLSNSNMSFIDAARKNGYGQFVRFIIDAGMSDIVSNHYYQPFTMFWPTDEAIDRLPADIKARLVSGNYSSELRKIFNYHIISKTKITTQHILRYSTGLSRRTQEGESLYVSCKGQQGDLYINDRSRIVQRDISFLEGIAFGISEVLLPHGVAGRCDEMKYDRVKGSCAFCNETGSCPPGTILQGVDQTSACFIQDKYLGCTSRCLRRTKQMKCCKNFYGPDCQACPGDVRNPCSGNGHCLDGLNGNGSCLCQESYHGKFCEICDSNNCDIGSKSCNSRKNPCSVFAVCKNGLCRCIAGYEGNGFYCQEIDPCQKNNGRCDAHAICTYLGPNSAICRCRPGYIGDGHTCLALPSSHPCATNNGNCHIYANCHEKDGKASCTCRRNFAGDGAFCGGNLMQVIYDIENLSEFAKMFRKLAYGVEGNRIIRLLSSEMEFTVFAPVNNGLTVKKLTIEELKNHIVMKTHTLKIETSETFLSLAKNNITVLKSKNNRFRINNIADVLGDYPAINGIIHVIDNVLPYIKPPLVVPTTKTTSTHETPITTRHPVNNTAKHAQNAGKNGNTMTIGITVGLVLLVLIIIGGVVVVVFMKKRRRPDGVRYNKNFESVLFESESYTENHHMDDDDDDEYEQSNPQQPSEDDATCLTNPSFDELLELTETSSSVPLTQHDELNRDSTSKC